MFTTAHPAPDGVTHHHAEVNGTKLHHVSAGTEGTPVVLVHGFPEPWWQLHPRSHEPDSLRPRALSLPRRRRPLPRTGGTGQGRRRSPRLHWLSRRDLNMSIAATATPPCEEAAPIVVAVWCCRSDEPGWPSGAINAVLRSGSRRDFGTQLSGVTLSNRRRTSDVFTPRAPSSTAAGSGGWRVTICASTC
jgi:hypothetical protein